MMGCSKTPPAPQQLPPEPPPVLEDIVPPIIPPVAQQDSEEELAGEVVYALDPARSTIAWKGSSVLATHRGEVRVKSGDVVVENGIIKRAQILVDMGTITNTDLKSGARDMLVNQLMSPDFFDVDTYPEAKFELTQVEQRTRTNPREPNVSLLGTLTIKDMSHTIGFPASITISKNELTGSATVTFDRSKFNVRYGSPSFFSNLGDNAIDDSVELTVSLAARVK